MMIITSRRALLGAAGACLSATCSIATAQETEQSVTITGQRLEETLPEQLRTFGSRVEVVDSQAIVRGGYNDVGQALQSLVPGLWVAPKSGAFDYVHVSLQGSRTADVLWLVDGVRIANRLYHTTTPLDTLPAHMIERIEVLKGGQGLFYGTQAIGGVINVITKGFTKEPDGGIQVGADTNDGQHVNGFFRGGFGSNHALVGYASYDDADGFQPYRDSDYQPSATDRERGYEVKTAGLKYAFEPSDAFRFSATYQHTDAEVDSAYAEDVAEAFNERDEDILSVKLDWQASERLAFYVKGYWHDWDSWWTRTDNTLGPNGQPNGTTSISRAALWRFEDRGVNVLSEFKINDGVTALLGYDFQEYEGRDDEFLIGQQSESVNAPFAQLRFNADVLSGATLALGVRHNSPSDGEESTVWNASGKLNVSDQTFVRAQLGTSFRLPSAYELYVIDPCCEQGNPNLVGEKSFNSELGIGYANELISVELMGFHRTVKDLIDIDFDIPAFPDGFLVNTDAEVEVNGAELVLSARLGDQLKLTFDYTYAKAELDDSGLQVNRVPKDLLKIIADWTAPSKRFGLSASLNRTGEVFDTVGGGVGRVEYGDDAIVDLSGFAYIDDARRHRIGLRVENLFDTEYASQLLRTRRDVVGTSYAARIMGTPLTGHLSYTYNF